MDCSRQCLLLLQAIGGGSVTGLWAFAFTYGMLWLINLVTVACVDAKAHELGLDVALHGEEAYRGRS